MASASGDQSRRVYVGGVFSDAQPADLHKLLSKFVSVDAVELKKRTDPATASEAAFAFVNVSAPVDKLNKCFKQLNGSLWKGKRLRLELARESFMTRLERERHGEAGAAAASTDGVQPSPAAGGAAAGARSRRPERLSTPGALFNGLPMSDMESRVLQQVMSERERREQRRQRGGRGGRGQRGGGARGRGAVSAGTSEYPTSGHSSASYQTRGGPTSRGSRAVRGERGRSQWDSGNKRERTRSFDNDNNSSDCRPNDKASRHNNKNNDNDKSASCVVDDGAPETAVQRAYGSGGGTDRDSDGQVCGGLVMFSGVQSLLSPAQPGPSAPCDASPTECHQPTEHQLTTPNSNTVASRKAAPSLAAHSTDTAAKNNKSSKAVKLQSTKKSSTKAGKSVAQKGAQSTACGGDLDAGSGGVSGGDDGGGGGGNVVARLEAFSQFWCDTDSETSDSEPPQERQQQSQSSRDKRRRLQTAPAAAAAAVGSGGGGGANGNRPASGQLTSHTSAQQVKPLSSDGDGDGGDAGAAGERDKFNRRIMNLAMSSVSTISAQSRKRELNAKRVDGGTKKYISSHSDLAALPGAEISTAQPRCVPARHSSSSSDSDSSSSSSASSERDSTAPLSAVRAPRDTSDSDHSSDSDSDSTSCRSAGATVATQRTARVGLVPPDAVTHHSGVASDSDTESDTSDTSTASVKPVSPVAAVSAGGSATGDTKGVSAITANGCDTRTREIGPVRFDPSLKQHADTYQLPAAAVSQQQQQLAPTAADPAQSSESGAPKCSAETFFRVDASLAQRFVSDKSPAAPTTDDVADQCCSASGEGFSLLRMMGRDADMTNGDAEKEHSAPQSSRDQTQTERDSRRHVRWHEDSATDTKGEHDHPHSGDSGDRGAVQGGATGGTWGGSEPLLLTSTDCRLQAGVEFMESALTSQQLQQLAAERRALLVELFRTCRSRQRRTARRTGRRALGGGAGAGGGGQWQSGVWPPSAAAVQRSRLHSH